MRTLNSHLARTRSTGRSDAHQSLVHQASPPAPCQTHHPNTQAQNHRTPQRDAVNRLHLPDTWCLTNDWTCFTLRLCNADARPIPSRRRSLAAFSARLTSGLSISPRSLTMPLCNSSIEEGFGDSISALSRSPCVATEEPPEHGVRIVKY